MLRLKESPFRPQAKSWKDAIEGDNTSEVVS